MKLATVDTVRFVIGSGTFYPSARIGLEGCCRRPPGGGRAGVTSHRYRSPGRSSYRIAVKLGGDESWGRISDEFVHGRRGSLIKRLTSSLMILTCQARYRFPGRSSYRIAVKLGGDESWGRISDEFVHGRRGSLIKRLSS